MKIHRIPTKLNFGCLFMQYNINRVFIFIINCVLYYDIKTPSPNHLNSSPKPNAKNNHFFPPWQCLSPNSFLLTQTWGSLNQHSWNQTTRETPTPPCWYSIIFNYLVFSPPITKYFNTLKFSKGVYTCPNLCLWLKIKITSWKDRKKI